MRSIISKKVSKIIWFAAALAIVAALLAAGRANAYTGDGWSGGLAGGLNPVEAKIVHSLNDAAPMQTAKGDAGQ